MKLTVRLAMAAAFLLIGGCDVDDGATTAPPSGSSAAALGLADIDPATVVATDRLGPILWADVDAAILQLGPDRRWPRSSAPREWLREITRRVAVDRLLYDEALLVGADRSPEFLDRERAILRNAYSNTYLAGLAPEPPPGDEVLAKLYEEQRDSFESPERRRVLNLFKRWGDDRDSTLAELEALRDRVIGGDSFETLAREHSDSETRHQGGELGFVPRGHFSKDFDDLVFGLEVDVPSPVVSTKDGGHLFLVSNILEARSLQLDDVRPLLLQTWRAGRTLQRLRDAAADFPLAAEAKAAGPQAVAAALRSQRRQSVVLEVGEFQLTAGGLYDLIRRTARLLGPQRPPDLARLLLDEIRHREVLYQQLRDDPAFEPPTEQIEITRRRQLIDFFGEQRLESWLDRQPALVQAHYDANVGRFSSPPRLDVTRLAVPRGDRDAAVMAELEAAVDRLDGGEITLETLAESLGGEISQLRAKTPAQLAAGDPGVRRFATLLRPGEHSPPITAAEQFVALRLDARQEPTERPLATVRDAVIRHYIDERGAAAFTQMSADLLREAEYEPLDGVFAGLVGE